MQSYKWSAASAAASPCRRSESGARAVAEGSLVDQHDHRRGIYGGSALRALVARPIAQMRRLDSHRQTRTREMYFMDGYTIYRVHRYRRM